MKKSKAFIIIAILVIIIIAGIGSKGEMVENLRIVVGIGNDIEKKVLRSRTMYLIYYIHLKVKTK